MPSFYEAALLGAIQGATEFLPISSSAHLLLMHKCLGTTPSLSILLFLHLATAASVFFFLRKRIWKILKEREWRLLLYICWGTALTGLLCICTKSFLDRILQEGRVIAASLTFTGTLLLLTQRLKKGEKPLSILSASIMGIAQGISAVPGISRMGMLICSGLLQGLRRESVAEYSLLLSLPTISAATLYQMYEDKEFAFFSLPSLFGFLVAFIVGLLCIKVLYNAVRRMSLTPFAIYCLALSLILWILL